MVRVSLNAGYAASSAGKISTHGPDIGAFSSFGDNEGPWSAGFAVGRRFWGNWRGDIDFTFRPKQKITRPHASQYTASSVVENGSVSVTSGGVTRTAPAYDVTTYRVTRDEEGRNADQTAMLNLYYDIPTGSIFTPYIGGGLGLVMRQTTREFKENGVCSAYESGRYVDPFTGATVAGAAGACSGQTVDAQGSKQSTGYGFAGALMAGVATEIARNVVFDIGYRFLWQDAGASLTLSAAVGPDSTLKFTERTDHEIRAAVRWYLD